MNGKQFRRFVDRDGGCIHCGELEAIAPHHRINRGMGGSKKLDIPSNIVVLCSVINGHIESDAEAAEEARRFGWKLSRGAVSSEVPIYIPTAGQWVLLDDEYKATPIKEEDRCQSDANNSNTKDTSHRYQTSGYETKDSALKRSGFSPSF